MKKYLLTLLTVLSCLLAGAQGARGVKIAYIDMDYILDKAPDYAEAKNQLEQKAQKWKQEIDVKRNEIKKLNESLKAERALLTKELIEEREEEIAFLEKDLLDFQEKKFGPTGDLVTQKSVLVKPIQDQIFTIVQDLAETRKYDFVFDKSSDLTMLFAANKHDISEFVLKRMERASKQETMSKKQLKKLEEDEKQEELESNPDYIDRQKKLEDKKAERDKKAEEKRAAREAKIAEAQAKREELRQQKEARKNGTTPPASNTGNPPSANANKKTASPATETDGDNVNEGENGTQVKTTATEAPEEGSAATTDKQNAAAAAKAERDKKAEDRRKAIEERKKQIAAEREAAKKARDDKKTKPAEDKPAEGTPSTPASPEESGDPQ